MPGEASREPGSDDTAAFDVVPIAITTYRPDSDRWPQLPEAEVEVREIGTLFERLGGRFMDWEVEPDGRELGAVTTRLHEWAGAEPPRNSVLIWLGHGTSNNDTASLIVPLPAGNHPMTPQELAERLVDRHRRRTGSEWAIVVVEACGAERFVKLIGSILLTRRASDGVLIVGSGSDFGSGYLGSFRTALNRVCSGYTANDTRITLGDFGYRLACALPQGYVFPFPDTITAEAVLMPPTVASVTAPVDAYRELRDALAKLSAQERIHFAGKGMGVHLGEVGWHFAGRETEHADIVRWLTGRDHGLLVLTGPAGTGKSAILGNLLLRAHPEIREALIGAGLVDGDGRHLPPPIDAALVLTGVTLHEMTDRFAELGGVDLPPGVTGGERATELLRKLRSRAGASLIVLVDGLDEAQDAIALAGLLREVSAIDGIRLVVGTRPGLAGPDGRSSASDETLLAELSGRADHVTVQRISRDPAAIATYVSRRLRAADGLRARLGDRLDDAIAVVIAALAKDRPEPHRREFLHTHLVVHELLADETLLLAGHSRQLDLVLAMGTRELFSQARVRMMRALPVSEEFLAVLAHVRGRGVPRANGLWTALASTLIGGDASETDLDGVLQLAGPYIMLDAADGQSVYRLAHRNLLEQYSVEPGYADRAALLARRLLDIAYRRGELNPYLRNHLSGQLADLGVPGWNELDRHPGVLDRLEITAVVSDAMRTPGGPARLPPQVLGAFMSAHLALAGGAADRAGLRQWGRASVDGFWSAATVADPETSVVGREAPAWELRWARVRRHTPHVTLAGHIGAVRALAVFPGPDDRVMLASAGDDCTIRLWDPSSARAVRSDLSRLTGPVLALAGCPQPGQPVRLVAVGDRDPVRFVDSRDGRVPAALPDRANVDRCVAVVPGASPPQVTVAGVRELTIWGSDGTRILSTPHGHTRWVGAIAVAVDGDRRLIVTADAGGGRAPGRPPISRFGRGGPPRRSMRSRCCPGTAGPTWWLPAETTG